MKYDTVSLGEWFPAFQRHHSSSKHLKQPIHQCSIISQSPTKGISTLM